MEKLGLVSVVLLNFIKPATLFLQDNTLPVGDINPLQLLIKGGESFSIVGLLSFLLWFLYQRMSKIEKEKKELENQIKEKLEEELEDLKKHKE